MSMRRLWEGSERDSVISRLDGRTKLLFLFFFALLMIFIDNPRTLFCLFTFSLLLHGIARTPADKGRMLLLFILLSLWGSIASQALFFAQTPKTPIAVLIPASCPVLGGLTGGLYIYREGIIYGAVQGMRAAAMLSLGLLVCWTSDPRQLLKGMAAWHMPPQAAFMLVTAVRFFPVMAAEAGEVMIALRLRSGSENGKHGILRHLPYLVKPLLARCIRRAQTLAMSVTSRGLFLAEGNRKEPWEQREKCFSLVFMAAVFFIGAAKLLYAFSEQGMYVGNLRILYDLVKLYL